MTNHYSIAAVFLFALSVPAFADTFGGGANTFDIEFVTVGNPGNPADTTGQPKPAGSVPYVYQIGKYEISRGMIEKANSEGSLGITLLDMTSYGGNGANRPATGATWNEACRFVNWLNTSQGFQPAYKFSTEPGQPGYSANSNISLWESGDAGYDPANRFRNTLAYYFLPTIDEWYKAAYYDPDSGSYFDFPTGSNATPTAVANGTAAGTAVFRQLFHQGPTDITNAGSLSPYGTMAQGGNVFELAETERDLVNDEVSDIRELRGGYWFGFFSELSVTSRLYSAPTLKSEIIGFRVASIVPEPSTLLLGALACFASRLCRVRRKSVSYNRV